MNNSRHFANVYAIIGGEKQLFSNLKTALCAAFGAKQVFGDTFDVFIELKDSDEVGHFKGDKSLMACRQIRSIIDIAVTECSGVDHNTIAQICASRMKFVQSHWYMPDAEKTPRKWWNWVEMIFGASTVIRYNRLISEALKEGETS